MPACILKNTLRRYSQVVFVIDLLKNTSLRLSNKATCCWREFYRTPCQGTCCWRDQIKSILKRFRYIDDNDKNNNINKSILYGQQIAQTIYIVFKYHLLYDVITGDEKINEI